MKNKLLSFTFIGLGILFILIQFIRPSLNNGNIHSPNHINSLVAISDSVESILQNSCYDCHSNQTNYPWYTQIQPIGFWLNNHVKEGKEELNFSEFVLYKQKKQLHKLDEMIEMIEEQEMPLKSYTWVHTSAELTPEQKSILVNWAKHSKTELQNKL
jgi:hypothetical protein